MPIKILLPQTSSRISAGEVIEDPGSVVKELIENSIDADATNIKVVLEDSGKKLISVSDNGCGMSKDDLSICLYRYSTSKIWDIDDLNMLKTYGFRGEALFSIFSVSKIRISTYNAKEENGWTIEGSGGNFDLINIFPSAPVRGTRVDVKELFFNTPARLKFLKSDPQIRSSVIKLLEEFALIRPEISFNLTINGKEIYNLVKRENIFKRIGDIFGDNFKDIVEINHCFDDLKINGFISKKFVGSRDFQYCYVNGRIIDSRTIKSAVYKAVENIRVGKHPVFLISINIPSSKIDVNVHPQKKEIKFLDEQFIYQSIFKLIEKIFSQIPNRIEIPQKSKVEFKSESKFEFISEKEVSKDYFTQDDFLNKMYGEKSLGLWYVEPISFIGQVFSSILIFQTPKSVIFIDQHAAAERITFERYIDQCVSQNLRVSKLLVPVNLTMPKSNISRIISMKQWLLESGFEINQNGPNSIMVYSTPEVFEFTQSDIMDIMMYLSDVISKPENISVELKRNTIALIACKKSIKFKEKIDEKTAMYLIEELKKTKDPLHCPHGRPTLLEITVDEMVRKFGRSGFIE